jgi:hypothetical protein
MKDLVNMTPTLTAFLDHVRIIVRNGPQPQMVWSKAIANIANVTDAHPVRDRAVHQLPHQPVNSLATVSMRDQAIPIGVQRASPQPTVTAHVYLRLEAVNERDAVPKCAGSVTTISATEMAKSALHLRRKCQKRVPARPAGAFNHARLLPHHYLRVVGAAPGTVCRSAPAFHSPDYTITSHVDGVQRAYTYHHDSKRVSVRSYEPLAPPG